VDVEDPVLLGQLDVGVDGKVDAGTAGTVAKNNEFKFAKLTHN
jgi:hypothetical protein